MATNDRIIKTRLGTKFIVMDEKTKRGFTWLMDGEPVTFNSLVGDHPRLGVLVVGEDPNYDPPVDGWSWSEKGGVIDVVFAEDESGNIWVGGVIQERKLQANNPVFNLIRGFLDPQETHFQAAKREMAEEFADLFQIPQVLEGDVLNNNSTFVETWDGNGNKAYKIRVSISLLEKDGDYYRFKNGVVKPATGDKLAEKILGAVFIPASEAKPASVLEHPPDN